jgi:hypothetical protein
VLRGAGSRGGVGAGRSLLGVRVSGLAPRRLDWAPTLRRSGKLPELEIGKLPESCDVAKVPELAALKAEAIG